MVAHGIPYSNKIRVLTVEGMCATGPGDRRLVMINRHSCGGARLLPP